MVMLGDKEAIVIEWGTTLCCSWKRKRGFHCSYLRWGWSHALPTQQVTCRPLLGEPAESSSGLRNADRIQPRVSSVSLSPLEMLLETT